MHDVGERIPNVPFDLARKHTRQQRCYQDQGVRDQDQIKTRQAETETETKTREAETKTKTKTSRVETKTNTRDLCCLGHDQHTQTVFIHRHLNIALQ